MQKDGYQTCILNKFTRRVVVETRVLLVTNTIRKNKKPKLSGSSIRH